MVEYSDIICENLRLPEEEFREIMDAPTHKHEEYAIEDNKTY